MFLTHAIYLVVVFVIGCLLFQSKVIAVKTIQARWLWYWNRDIHLINVAVLKPGELEVDCDILSSSLLWEFVLETAPQLVFQVLNVSYMQKVTFVNVFSIAFSALMLMRISIMCFNRVILMKRTLVEFIESSLRTTSDGIKDSLSSETMDNKYYEKVVAALHQHMQVEEYTTDLLNPEIRLFYLLKTSVLDGTMNCYLTEHNINNATKLLTCRLEILNGLILTYASSLETPAHNEPSEYDERVEIVPVNRIGDSSEICELLEAVLQKRPVKHMGYGACEADVFRDELAKKSPDNPG